MINRLNEIARLLDKVSNSPSVVRHIPELTEARGLLQNMIDDANEPENRSVRLVNPYVGPYGDGVPFIETHPHTPPVLPQRYYGPYGDGVPFGQ